MKKGALILSVFALLCSAVPAYAVQSVTSDTTESADGITNGVHFSSDNTLTVADNSSLNTGANANGVTTTTDNTGSLGFLGTSTVTGVVGSSATVRLGRIDGGRTEESVIFSGNVFAVGSTVSRAGTLIFNGNLTGSTLNYNADGNVLVGDNGTITPTITTSTTNTGSLGLAGTATVSGQVGTSAARLRIVTGGLNAEEDTFSSDVFSVITSVQQSGTLIMNGNLTGSFVRFDGNGTLQIADGKSISGATIHTVTDNSGSLAFLGASTISTAVGTATTGDLRRVEISGGVVTLTSGGVYAVNDTAVRPLGTLKINQAQTITGNLTLVGTGIVDVGANTVTVTGTYTQPATSTFRTTITNSTTAGNIVATTADPTVAAGSTIVVDVAGYVPNGTAYTIVDTDGGAAAVAVPTTINDNSASLTFAGSGAGGDLILTATRSSSGLTTSANAGSVATSLNTFSSGATGDMATVMQNLDRLGTAAQYDAAVQLLDPDVNGGLNQAAFNTIDGAFSTIGTRLENARNGVNSGGGQKGIAMGDESVESAMWMQGFGGSGDQDSVSGIAGYDSTTYGAAMGADYKMDFDNRVGLSFAYAKSDVDTKGGTSNVDVDSYQGSMYGGYDNPTGQPYYIDWMLGFGWNSYEGSRVIQFANIDRIAQAEYDGQQYTGKVNFGYEIPFGDWTLVPLASLMYSHLRLEEYTETGAQALNLVVDGQDYDFLMSGLGARIETSFKDGQKRTWAPEFHALWLYEFLQDEADATSRFSVSNATSFTTSGLEPEQSRFNVGGGITLWPTESLSFNVRYDFEYRDDYTGHGGSGTVRYKF